MRQLPGRGVQKLPVLLVKVNVAWQPYVMPIAMWITVVLAIFIWGGVLIWSVWRAAWLRGAVIGVASIISLLLASADLAGAQPVAYGLTLGLSLFLGSAMVAMGLIAHAVQALARLDRG